MKAKRNLPWIKFPYPGWVRKWLLSVGRRGGWGLVGVYFPPPLAFCSSVLSLIPTNHHPPLLQSAHSLLDRCRDRGTTAGQGREGTGKVWRQYSMVRGPWGGWGGKGLRIIFFVLLVDEEMGSGGGGFPPQIDKKGIICCTRTTSSNISNEGQIIYRQKKTKDEEATAETLKQLKKTKKKHRFLLRQSCSLALPNTPSFSFLPPHTTVPLHLWAEEGMGKRGKRDT